MDFAALPPEINSGLMYAGPGSGPMLAAAAAWDDLASQLYSTASSYGSVVADLTSGWQGPSSATMAAAATPYVSWIGTTAGQAAETGAQAKAAAAAYEAAFAMTVPPPVIAANRALLLLLVATNFFGQNTPAIMATEAQYMEMWAQDAAAMYGYQAAAQAASVLSPFTTPAPTAAPGGVAEQAAAVGQAASTSAGTSAQTVAPLTSAASTPLSSALSTTPLSSALSTTPLSSSAALPNTVSGAATTATATSSSTSTSELSSLSGLTSSSSTALTSATGTASGTGTAASMTTTATTMLGSASSLMKTLSPAASVLTNQLQAWGSAFTSGVGSGAINTAGMGSAAMSANVGRAATLGVLSVPQNWATAAPAFSQVSTASSILPATGANAVPAVAAANPGVVPPPLATLAARESTPMVSTPRFDVRPTVVQRPVAAG